MKSTAMYRTVPLLFVLLVLGSAVGEVDAGRLFESRAHWYEECRQHCDPIVLVTLRDVRCLSQDEVDRQQGLGWLTSQPHYTFRGEVVETLRGTPVRSAIRVPFAVAPFPESQSLKPEQREARLEGHRAVILVNRNPALVKTAFNVWPVSSFDDDDRVRFWRKMTTFWNLPDAAARRRALRAGCHDSLPEFQEYCCRRLSYWEETPDRNAAEQLEPLSAWPIIWKQFVHPDTPVEVLSTCDQVLSGMSPGWLTHPARYDVLERAVRRQTLSKDKDNSFEIHDPLAALITTLSHAPGRESQTFKLLLEIMKVRGKHSWYAAMQLCHLYRPHATAPQQVKMNREILTILDRELRGSDPANSVGAADAVTRIVNNYSWTGDAPSHVLKLLNTPAEQLEPTNGSRIVAWFQEARDQFRASNTVGAAVLRKRQDGHAYLCVPGKALVGRQVVFVVRLGQFVKDDPVFGHQVYPEGSYREPVWLEASTKWPPKGVGWAVMTGTLEERRNVPTFPLRANMTRFANGLPLPAGYDVLDIQRRFVVCNVEWEVLPSKKQ